ncbi:MAG: acyltransferase [Candidatus Electrothrix sp. LOE1_4_5]|nr:acyltransferase [Candidatus Electrothrix gigas]
MSQHNQHLIHPKYRPDIDGLRAIAVLSVVGFHAFPSWVKGGFIGVDVFFVISGFLISGIIYENLDKKEFTFREFYARRIMRIFPALIVVMTTCFAFGWLLLLTDEYKQLGKHIAGGASFISNFLLWQESGYFDNSAETKPLLHLWSLGIEEQFYIIWPLLLWLTWKRKFNIFAVTLAIAVGSFYLNIKGIKQDAVATFYSPITRFWELMCGGLLAWVTIYKKESFANICRKVDRFIVSTIYRNKETEEGRTLANLFAFTGLALLTYGFVKIAKDFYFPGAWALVPVLAALLIISAGPAAWINRQILSTKVFVWFGLISYPLYLWHWPLLSFARIFKDHLPHHDTRIAIVAVSIVLAWLTTIFIEKPFRSGDYGIRLKVTILCCLLIGIGVSGVIVNKTGLSQIRTLERVNKLRNTKYKIGSSFAWYRGKEDWLFLGNAYDQTVEKLMLDIEPSKSEIEETKKLFAEIANTGEKSNTKIVLILGPNKSSIYPEFLPDKFDPPSKRYSSFFLDSLKDVQNLIVYNPTEDFLRLKNTEGILYWMTNTHWNHKGSFLAYSGFSKALGLPVPKITFQHGSTHSGDLINIAKLTDFPLHAEDNWDVIWANKPLWTETEIPNQEKTTFGVASIVKNHNSLSDKYIWVVGDSFTSSLRQYFNATFKEVCYIGHWSNKLRKLPEDLAKADRKPDMVVIVRVERSF